jgi:sterol carrier protein 2
MGRRVNVIGVGMVKFQKPGASEDYHVMASKAARAALADAKVEYGEIEQAYAGYVFGDSTCGQRAIYEVGLTGIPVVNVNNNCATGSTALYLGRQAIEGGLAECVIVVGFEQMEKGALGSKFNDRTNPMDQHAGVMSRVQGFNQAPPTAQMFGRGASTGGGTGRSARRSARSRRRRARTRRGTRTRSSTSGCRSTR